MNRILIVDDERSICEMVKLCLSKNNYLCDIAGDGLVASQMIEQNKYDLILLDVMLPEIDGFELMPYIKEFNIPVIFISARTLVEDRIRGLKLGAEDYLVKPFDLNELLARIEVVLRRYRKNSRVYTYGKITIDSISHEVLNGQQLVTLSNKEYELLLYLIQNPCIALYREQIYENVWNEPYFGNTRTVDLHIQRLKKKLNWYDEIETIYKVGYKFNPKHNI